MVAEKEVQEVAGQENLSEHGNHYQKGASWKLFLHRGRSKRGISTYSTFISCPSTCPPFKWSRAVLASAPFSNSTYPNPRGTYSNFFQRWTLTGPSSNYYILASVPNYNRFFDRAVGAENALQMLVSHVPRQLRNMQPLLFRRPLRHQSDAIAYIPQGCLPWARPRAMSSSRRTGAPEPAYKLLSIVWCFAMTSHIPISRARTRTRTRRCVRARTRARPWRGTRTRHWFRPRTRTRRRSAWGTRTRPWGTRTRPRRTRARTRTRTRLACPKKNNMRIRRFECGGQALWYSHCEDRRFFTANNRKHFYHTCSHVRSWMQHGF